MDTKLNLRVSLPNGSCNLVKCSDSTTIKDVIGLVVGRLSAGHRVCREAYALRLKRTHTSSEICWLRNDLTIRHVMDIYNSITDVDDHGFELRVRYLPKNAQDLLAKDRLTFNFFYDQTKNEYLDRMGYKVSQESAIQLACLEIRRAFKDMEQNALEKKSNIEYLEKEIGWTRFLPKSIVDTLKVKHLRKQVQQTFKLYSMLSEEECMLNFLELLKLHWRYDHERFHCALGPTHVADFAEVQSIQTLSSETDSKARLKLSVFGTTESLVITASSMSSAEDIADVIDNYCRLVNRGNSCWHHKGDPQCRIAPRSTPVSSSSVILHTNAVPTQGILLPASKESSELVEVEEDSDYSSLASKNYELDRSHVKLLAIIGKGQFGDVHRGVYTTADGGSVEVAVKTCREDSDLSISEKFLEEAYIMQQFEHMHIIRLMGISSQPPIWIVMELAQLGEMRSYLQANKAALSTDMLVMYCYQLSTALSYLDGKHFVHRDVAARNVLVSSRDCVKLADFGLSRSVTDQSYYKATKGKLPIKWMAPESINFRRFTTTSDVWMFGVCMWEIMMYGIKPFAGIKNNDVIGKIEAGERLPLPVDCPPAMYNVMCACWTFEPSQRPSIATVKKCLSEILTEERKRHEDELQRNTLRHVQTSSCLSSDSDETTDVTSSEPPPKPIRPKFPVFHHPLLVASNSTPSLSAGCRQLSLLQPSVDSGGSLTAVTPLIRASSVSSYCHTGSKSSDDLAESNMSSASSSSYFQSADTYASYQPAPPPLGYIVAFTPDQVTDIIRDQYRSGYASNMYRRPDTTTADSKKSSAVDPERRHSLEQQLFDQRRQSADDARWLQKEEVGLRTILGDRTTLHAASMYDTSLSDAELAKSNEVSNAAAADNIVVSSRPASILPTGGNRVDDAVYGATMNVVRAVMMLCHVVQSSTPPDQYTQQVKVVGLHLRELLQRIDVEMNTMASPAELQQSVLNCEKVVNHAMAELVNSMRRAQQYHGTAVAVECSHTLLASARSLAVNAKCLFDAVDLIRKANDIECFHSENAIEYNQQQPELFYGKRNSVVESCERVVDAEVDKNERPVMSSYDTSDTSALSQLGHFIVRKTQDQLTLSKPGSICNFDLLTNSDEEYEDEKFPEGEPSALSPDFDPLSSEADRCLEAVEQTNHSDRDDFDCDMDSSNELNVEQELDLITSALRSLQ